MTSISLRLGDAGMSEPEAGIKSERFGRLLTRLGAVSDGSKLEMYSFWVPGRIEVLGKHTDYGGGRSLLCAVERGICIATRPHGGSSRIVRISGASSGQTAQFELSADIEPRRGHWSNYPITVARRIAMNFSGPMRGADIVFDSDLPSAAGLSSSSALVVSVFLALSAVNDLESRPEYRANITSPEDLGGYLGCVENGLDFKALRGSAGVGTFGGSEDQTAILCARPDAVVQYSFCPVTFERAIPLPDGCSFVIASSGVVAAKTGAALDRYNRVSRRLTCGLEAWRSATGRTDISMGAALASSADAPDCIREVLRSVSTADFSSQSLVERFDQFVNETAAIIPAAGDALERGDLTAFGEQVALSQDGAERALENQIPETVALVRQARSLGAIAASAFGAGFGGSVWALTDAAPHEFCNQWRTTYARQFPHRAAHSDFFVTRTGPAAMRV